VSKKVGSRKNANKLRWRCFPMFLMKPLIEVAHAGSMKYSDFNFLNGQYVNNCLDSMKRHMEKAESPYESDIDDETGCYHFACIAWNALVACYMVKYRPDLDDRWKPEKRKK
jgi:Domain of unknown function (DUF5664)